MLWGVLCRQCYCCVVVEVVDAINNGQSVLSVRAHFFTNLGQSLVRVLVCFSFPLGLL